MFIVSQYAYPVLICLCTKQIWINRLSKFTVVQRILRKTEGFQSASMYITSIAMLSFDLWQVHLSSHDEDFKHATSYQMNFLYLEWGEKWFRMCLHSWDVEQMKLNWRRTWHVSSNARLVQASVCLKVECLCLSGLHHLYIAICIQGIIKPGREDPLQYTLHP